MATDRILIDGVLRIDPRQTRAWRRLKTQVVAEEPTCRLRIPTICTTVSTTADHIVPVAERPELALERTNVRGSCVPCNRARGHLPDEALNREPRSEALGIFG
jgi:5-methylcytosine-specific restriction endonuclease McrA